MVGPSTDGFQQPSTQLLIAPPHASNTAISLEEICDIYRETVMSVDHYTDLYGDTLEESLAQEFGPEVATTMTTSDQLTPQLRDRLVNCSQQARESRQSLLQGLKSEHTALEAADEKLTRLGADLDDVVGGARSTTGPRRNSLMSTNVSARANETASSYSLIDRPLSTNSAFPVPIVLITNSASISMSRSR